MSWSDYFDTIPKELELILGNNVDFSFVERLNSYCFQYGNTGIYSKQFGITTSGKNVVKTTDVREHCRIGGSVYACEGSVLGRCGELKESIFFPKARAPHFSFVAQSILGEDCNLGAGTITANVRFGNPEKCGAIIGDRVKTGVNVSIMPGTLIGKDSFLYPGIRIKGTIPPGSVIKDSNF